MTTSPKSLKKVLNVGCGNAANQANSLLQKLFPSKTWQEVRLDIDPAVKPDIVADMRKMDGVANASFDGIWASHNIEHLFAHEVPLVFREFFRVLKNDGMLALGTPDLHTVAEAIIKKGLETPLYHSPAGPITAIDILYGHRISLAKGKHFMTHRTGFTARTLAGALQALGFRDVRIQRDGFNLWATAYRRAEDTKQNQRIHIIEPDINELMRQRDRLEQEPEIWQGFPPKKASS